MVERAGARRVPGRIALTGSAWQAVGRSTGRLLPWALFGGMLLWRWGGRDLLHTLPEYGDALEMAWGTAWYGDALRSGVDPGTFPLAFFPAGWHLGTFGQSVGPWLFLALVPLYWLGGAALAYNVSTLLTFVLAFAGGLKLARRFLGPVAATTVALLFTFWSFRWYAIIGHTNMLLGSALVPWLIWAIERGLAAERRAWRWFVVAGLAWAGMVAGSLYFVFIGGLLALLWLLGRRLAGQSSWRAVLCGLAIPAAVMLALSAPGIWWSWQGGAQAEAVYSPFVESMDWSASLNSLFAPFIRHPWLAPLAQAMYRGEPWEQGATNLGLAATVAALMAVPAARRRRRWWPALLLAPVGVVLALGPVLKWDNDPLQWSFWQPLDRLLWQVGHLLKPGTFVEPSPPAPFDAVVPLPGYLLAVAMPFVERARVFARYALVAGAGLFLLAGLAVDRLPRRWQQVALAALLIFEVAPPALPGLPFPPAAHPAYEWLAQQAIPDQAIADVIAAHPSTLGLKIGGEVVWATRCHGQATVSGASSVWPGCTRFLNGWLVTHQHPFWSPDLTTILRAYRVRYLVLHAATADDRALWEEARSDPELRRVSCFEPAEGAGPWRYPICILEVLPAPYPEFNVVLGDGWSGREDWGVWAEGTAPSAQWIATERRDHVLALSAFPNCVPGQQQQLAVEVNGRVLAEYRWPNCDPWTTEVRIPADVVKVGGNDLVLRAGYAISPAQARPGESNDTRRLSVGVTRMKVE